MWNKVEDLQTFVLTHNSLNNEWSDKICLIQYCFLFRFTSNSTILFDISLNFSLFWKLSYFHCLMPQIMCLNGLYSKLWWQIDVHLCGWVPSSSVVFSSLILLFGNFLIYAVIWCHHNLVIFLFSDERLLFLSFILSLILTTWLDYI